MSVPSLTTVQLASKCLRVHSVGRQLYHNHLTSRAATSAVCVSELRQHQLIRHFGCRKPSIVAIDCNRSHLYSQHRRQSQSASERCSLLRTLHKSSAQSGLNLKPLSRNFSTTMTTYTTEERGALNSTDYRIFYKNEAGNPISPWHDIPLFADKSKSIYNMVVEIPRWTNAKMEIATAEPLNPIKQDVKKGALRFVRNPFPHKGYIWNYGAIPQTWEDPNHIDPGTNAKGDNDPIDAIEIGSRVANRGEVIQVKILGTVALIDEGETDWKIITINVKDELADQLNDIGDVEKLLPGLLHATVEWFKIYKIPDGKPANEFAFNGEAKNREFAEKVVEETHTFWKDLLAKTPNDSKLELKNTTLANSYSVSADDGKAVLEAKTVTSQLVPVPIVDQTAIDKWYYIKL